MDAAVVFLIICSVALSETQIRCGLNHACNCTVSAISGTDVKCSGVPMNVSQICEVCSTVQTMFQQKTSLDFSNVNQESGLSIPDFCFHNCTELRKLYLSSNSINYIEDNTFDGLFKVHRLDLHVDGNKFIVNGSFVKPRIFQNLLNLRVLPIQGNSDTYSLQNKHCLRLIV